jgi:LacI family transcriptional regulator
VSPSAVSKVVHKASGVSPQMRARVTASVEQLGYGQSAAAGDQLARGQAPRVTLQDVARDAGVSAAAVSKVVRGAYGVSPKMKAKVSAAVDRLGYRPHYAARAMRGRSYTVGVLLPDLAFSYPTEVAQALLDELQPTPFQGMIVAAGLSPSPQQQTVEALIDRQMDGLILIAPTLDASSLEEIGAKIPLVVVGRHGSTESFDTVVDDDHHGAALMVSHLVSLGHERILHTSQADAGLRRPHVLSHTARHDGYVDAIKQHGFRPDVIFTKFTEAGGHEAALQAFARARPPTAIFAGADLAAFGALRAAEERGVRVPEDVTITGYDNMYISTLGRVGLTTIDQSARLTGSTSARLLLERMDGRTAAVRFVVTPKLVVRTTSGPPPDLSPGH